MTTKLRTTPRFVTPSDFENYTGHNLSYLLKANENESNKANLFLMDIEECLLARIDATSFRVTQWDRLTGFQLESLQKAIIKQAEYILRNSDLFTDSGYDLEKGQLIPFEELQKIAICRTSIDYLKNCGLFNQVISNKNRFLSL